MSPRALALALCGLFACSAPDPAPLPSGPAATPVAAKPVTPADAKPDDGKVSLLPAINSPAPAKEPPLTQEELDLLAADPATLTPELRRKRAFALRRKILQNPDSPTARQLEALRLAYEKGDLQPQLPDAPKTSDSGIVLKARPSTTTPGPATSAPTTSPTAAPTTTPPASEPTPAKTP